MREGQILYAKIEDTYVLKFSGDVRYTICAPLSAFIKQLKGQQGFDDILIDLTETEGIDSTNLGLLARIANLMQERFHRKSTVISTNPNINRTLEAMGFYDVFNIDTQYSSPAVHGRSLPMVEEKEQEIADAILQAHRTLAQLNETNREMFRSVVEALECDLTATQETPTPH